MYVVFFFCPVEVFSQGTWAVLKDFQDPELQELVGRLPNTILHSRADSTVKKYLAAFKRWKAWASQHEIPVIPAKDCHVVLYLQHIGDTVGSKAAVEEACNALAWVHSAAGLAPPMASPIVRATLEGLQRMLAKPVVKKVPVTVEILERMVEDSEQSGTLSDLRLITACLLSFAGFLRFSELIHIRPCDISVREDAIVLKLPCSKTDQLRRGDEVIVARSGKATCPVTKLEDYMRRAGIPWQDQRYLFRAICKSKAGDKLRESGKISYSCLREQFKKKLGSLGYNHVEFGLHSLRAGGATRAANMGVPDRLFKRHGRWKSENAKDGYIDDSVEHRLAVTKQLGL